MRLPGALASALIVAACAPAAPLRAPIEDFERGVAATARAIAVYYDELNALERDLYLDERVRDPSLELAYRSGEVPTPLGGATFSADSIAARLEALDLLGLYGARLAALADTGAPEAVGESLTSLGARVDEIRVTFARLEGSDRTASRYGGPLGQLAGALGQGALERRRDTRLRAAVEEAGPAVEAVIELLQADLDEIVRPLRLTGTRVTVSNLVTDYNARRQQMSEAQRRTAINRIRDAQERYEAALLFNPSGLMQNLKDAHAALELYARTAGDERSAPARLAGSLEVFRERAEDAREAVERLQRPRSGS
jgi:hypothetical protein